MGGPCKDCPAGGKRPAPYPGPRCATHHRQVKRARRATAHETRVGKLYGLAPGDYARLLEAQGGVCALCREATGAVRRLAVDHDHATGEVRGLLCMPCNRDVLGRGREMLVRALEYLDNPPARKFRRAP